jgi:hypothetical protein
VQKREYPNGHSPANPSTTDRHQCTPRHDDDAGKQKGMPSAGLGQQDPGNGRNEDSRKWETLKEG